MFLLEIYHCYERYVNHEKPFVTFTNLFLVSVYTYAVK